MRIKEVLLGKTEKTNLWDKNHNVEYLYDILKDPNSSDLMKRCAEILISKDQQPDPLNEAIYVCNINAETEKELDQIFANPLPAVMALSAISQYIEADSLADEIQSLVDAHPGRDARQLIADWMKINIPQQLNSLLSPPMPDGTFSPVSGISDEIGAQAPAISRVPL